MYQKFDIIAIATNLLDKSITLEFSQDVDEDTVCANNLIVAEKESNEIVSCDYEAQNKVIKIRLKDWPKPNCEYLLVAQPGILSVVGRKLETSLKRKIVFKSKVVSTVEILAPCQFEEIEEVKLHWQEKHPPGFSNEENYYIEIASDSAFVNKIVTTLVQYRTEVALAVVDPGQLFMRIRAQSADEYGPWSETVTFLYKTKADEHNLCDIDDRSNDASEPSYEQEVQVICLPENGVTNATFVIEFDEELLPDAELEISVYRRQL